MGKIWLIADLRDISGTVSREDAKARRDFLFPPGFAILREERVNPKKESVHVNPRWTKNLKIPHIRPGIEVLHLTWKKCNACVACNTFLLGLTHWAVLVPSVTIYIHYIKKKVTVLDLSGTEFALAKGRIARNS